MQFPFPQSTAALSPWAESVGAPWAEPGEPPWAGSLDPDPSALRQVQMGPLSLGIPVEISPPQTRVLTTDEPVVSLYDRWIGAGIPWPIELYRPMIQPEVIVKPSARSMLTDRVRAILNRLVILLGREAERRFVAVSKIEVSGFVDPEEDTEEVVVTQWVKVSPEAALDYWDRLGASIEVWIDSLPEGLRRVALERLAVEVRWDIADATV